ncbi:MAG TPA: AmpG family muropeptide MFS transporter, partial [Chromatiales bacterium]|nr:AmpG family muropeptide MFS transporter [Chromatiales bacterium]
MLFLGFSSGLPLMLVFSSLSFWLREAGIERSLIGFISWVALAYAFKWVWSPLVDRMPLPLLTRLMGRRRAWMLLAQMVVMSGLVGMALSDPREDLMQLVAFAVTVAFASATQDIVIDAYRIESVDPDLQGAMASTYMIGYRLAMILGSAGALGIAAFFDPSESSYEQAPWMASYGIMAGMMLVGVVTTLLISEPKVAEN